MKLKCSMISNGYENIDRNICFSHSRKIVGHELTFVQNQCRLDITKYLFSQRTIN